MECKRLPFQPVKDNGDQFALSISIWNMMRGIDWNGLELIAEMHGIIDIEELVLDLCTIRDHQINAK